MEMTTISTTSSLETLRAAPIASVSMPAASVSAGWNPAVPSTFTRQRTHEGRLCADAYAQLDGTRVGSAVAFDGTVDVAPFAARTGNVDTSAPPRGRPV